MKGVLLMYASQALRRISKEQIKIIYTLGNALGIVDQMATRDLLHELVESMTGRNHVSELTAMQANDVISRLKANMRGCGRYKVDDLNVPGMASKG